MDVANDIAKIFGLPSKKISHVRDRAFNDRRYYICDDKLWRLGRASPLAGIIARLWPLAHPVLLKHCIWQQGTRHTTKLHLLCCSGWVERTSWEEGLQRTIKFYLQLPKDYWNARDVEQALAPHPIMHSKQNKELS